MVGFSDYLDPGISLENRLKQIFNKLHIDNNKRKRIINFLKLLKNKDMETYRHSIRVGLLTCEIAHFLHLDEKTGFYSGILHDIGKSRIKTELLQKNDNWTPTDAKEMQPHVLVGYYLIINSNFFRFSAEIMLWHHKFQTQGYPLILPKSISLYSLDSKTMIKKYGRILALADQYDAMHRINNKLGILTGEQIKKKMFEFNHDQQKLIAELYKTNIFTTNMVRL